MKSRDRHMDTGQVSRKRATGKQEIVRNYLALAREFRRQNLLHKAEQTYLVALEKVPNHPFLLTGLANLYIQMNMLDESKKILNRLIKHHPEQSLAYFLRGKIYQLQRKNRFAIQNYQKALRGSKKDLFTLYKLVPLLIESGKPKQALEYIYRYRELFRDANLFSRWEAEARHKMGESDSAVKILENQLKSNPGDKKLLQRYLYVSMAGSGVHPVEAFRALKQQIPELPSLEEKELLNLEIEFQIKMKQYDKALDLIELLLQREPGDSFWRKRRAFLYREMGREDESIRELTELFLENPGDPYIRSTLENYFQQNNRLREWKQLLGQALQQHPEHGELFGFLRRVSLKKDWLETNKWQYPEFIHAVEKLSLRQADIYDPTFRKLPLYVLENFIQQIHLTHMLLSPEDLYAYLEKKRQHSGHGLPFEIADLDAAYPAWLFGLQFYFLFKTYSRYDYAYIPALFQRHQIAVILTVSGIQVFVECGYLLNRNKPFRLKEFVKKRDGYHWRWPESPAPARRVQGIPFYSENQFLDITDRLKQQLPVQN